MSKIDRHANITIFTPTKLSVNNDLVDRVATGLHVLTFSRLQNVSKIIQKQNTCIKINNIKLSLLTTTTHMALNVGTCDKFTL